MLIAMLLTVAQAATEVRPPFVPGNQFYWQTPCTMAKPDPDNAVQRLAEGFLALSGDGFRVVRCVQPAGSAVPVMWSKMLEDRIFLIVYSEELEADDFPRDALRGIVAHEVAHVRLDVGCLDPLYREPTEQNYLACESRVDREAAILVGPGAVRAGLEQYHRLHVRMASTLMSQVRRHLIEVRLRLLTQAVSTAEPFSVSTDLTAVAAGIAREAGLPQRVTVYIVEAWRGKGIVNAMTVSNDERINIYVSPLLMEDADAQGMRAVLAHELAHTRHRCGPKPQSDAKVLACEHRADVLSARWVGRATALRGLCQVMASGWRWRYTTDASMFVERIRLLHHRQDIP